MLISSEEIQKIITTTGLAGGLLVFFVPFLDQQKTPLRKQGLALTIKELLFEKTVPGSCEKHGSRVRFLISDYFFAEALGIWHKDLCDRTYDKGTDNGSQSKGSS